VVFKRAGVHAVGKLSGAALIVAGLAIGAYTLSGRQPTGAGSAAAPPREAAKAGALPGTANPAGGQAEVAAAPPAAPQPDPQAAAAPSAAKRAEPQPQPQPEVFAGKSGPPPAVRIGEAPPRVPVDQNKPAAAAPLDREAVTREIQRQLKRVGCYGGAITGVWSPAVRQAMKAFTDRVNAALPVDQPDQILLALVQNHQQVTCAACPAGQAAGGDGRCLPNALVGRVKAAAPAPANAHAPTPASTTAPAAAAPPATQPTERMSLAGPTPANRPARIKPATSSWHYAPTAQPSRYAETRNRERRRTSRPYAPQPSGPPWWLPFFSP
jgi:hypothetical protein